jgi:acyl-CoA hydrolase
MANILGDLFGGNLMALVDQAAAIAAIRHSGVRVVTASIHQVDFRERIPIGSLVTCRSTVDFVGNSSMDITVEVYREIPTTGERKLANVAHVVFVAIDEHGRPKRVPRLVPATAEEKERYLVAEQYRKDHPITR